MKLLLLASLTLLTACGVQRPLIAPKDIPAHEERIKRKRERLEETPVTVTTEPQAQEPAIMPGPYPATGGTAQ